MKKFLSTVSNTYKVIQLLSNPQVQTFIAKNINAVSENHKKPAKQKLGRRDVYYHKHFMVQVVN